MELEDVPFQFLQEITDSFSDDRKLGEGAFGVVYKVCSSQHIIYSP
jgi:hypothetical protein